MRIIIFVLSMWSMCANGIETDAYTGSSVERMVTVSKLKISISKKLCRGLKRNHKYDMIRNCNEMTYGSRITHAIWNDLLEGDLEVGLDENSLTELVMLYSTQLQYLRVLNYVDLDSRTDEHIMMLTSYILEEMTILKNPIKIVDL